MSLEALLVRGAEYAASEEFEQDLMEARLADEEVQIFGLVDGLIYEKKSNNDMRQQAIDAISNISELKDVSNRDIEKIVDWFIDQDAASLLVAPGIPHALFRFITDIGFPATRGAMLQSHLSAPRFSTGALITAMVGAGVLSVVSVPAADAMKVKHTWKEAKDFKADPKAMVDVYEYDVAFIRGLSDVLKKLKNQQESLESPGIKFHSLTRLESEMESLKKLEEIENRLKGLTASPIAEASSQEHEEEQESEVVKAVNEENIEKFIDGILIILGELEASGRIPQIEDAKMAKDAVLGVIRKLYQKRGLVSKMSRKYARFGAKRVLRRARQDIGKALA